MRRWTPACLHDYAASNDLLPACAYAAGQHRDTGAISLERTYLLSFLAITHHHPNTARFHGQQRSPSGLHPLELAVRNGIHRPEFRKLNKSSAHSQAPNAASVCMANGILTHCFDFLLRPVCQAPVQRDDSPSNWRTRAIGASKCEVYPRIKWHPN